MLITLGLKLILMDGKTPRYPSDEFDSDEISSLEEYEDEDNKECKGPRFMRNRVQG